MNVFVCKSDLSRKVPNLVNFVTANSESKQKNGVDMRLKTFWGKFSNCVVVSANFRVMRVLLQRSGSPLKGRLRFGGNLPFIIN